MNTKDWLDRVVGLPPGRGKRKAWVAAHALVRHARVDGVVTVTLDQLTRETGLHATTLRAGFEELEAAGLLERDRLTKQLGSNKWDARTYRLRAGGKRSLNDRAADLEQAENASIGVMSSEPKKGQNLTALDETSRSERLSLEGSKLSTLGVASRSKSSGPPRLKPCRVCGKPDTERALAKFGGRCNRCAQAGRF